MAGRLVRDGDDVCFVPRFPFVDGTSTPSPWPGRAVAVLTRPRPERPAVPRCLAIHPTAAEVPRNLLRLYVWFSAPMSEGYAAGHVRLVDAAGDTLAGALLPTEHELWERDRRRLTVLLDPARIKRGLAAHRQAGYPLRSRRAVPAGGRRRVPRRARPPLRGARRAGYAVGRTSGAGSNPAPGSLPPRRRHPRAARGHLRPARSTTACSAAACASPARTAGRWRAARARPGRTVVAADAAPPWAPGPHQLVVDPVLEDLAGNSVSRVFDRDLARPDDDPRLAQPVAVTFRPR